MVLADPGCIEASVKQEVLINRNSVLFSVRPPGELGSREVFCFVLFCFLRLQRKSRKTLCIIILILVIGVAIISLIIWGLNH